MPNNLKYRQNDSLTSNKDTIYGIKTEQNIPYRKLTTKFHEKTTTHKSEKSIDFEPFFRVKQIEGWQTGLVVLGFFLVAFVKAFNSSRFNQSLKALFSYTVSQEVTREEKVFFHRANLLLTLNYLVSTTLFVYYFSAKLNLAFKEPIVNYLFLLLIFVVLYSTKYLFARILFFIFNNTSLSIEYIFNVSLFNNFLGVLLLPSLGFIYFSDISTSIVLNYFAIPSILISFIFRVIRLFVLGNNKGISYLYIFLYICTLEILPLVVLFRFFILK